MVQHVAQGALAWTFANHRDVDLRFFGGEPLLAWDLLIECARSARALARSTGSLLRMHITTNGTILDLPRARILRDLGVNLTVSLDGPPHVHNLSRIRVDGGSSFDAAVGGALAAREADGQLAVVAVVTPENARLLAQSVAFLVELGAKCISLNAAWEAAWDDDALGALEQQIDDVATQYACWMREGRPIQVNWLDDNLIAALHGQQWLRPGCGFGVQEMAVAPSGNIYACERQVRDDSDRRFMIGRVQDDGTVVLRKRTVAPCHAPARACVRCAERWRCTSRCACANLAETGSIHRPGGVQCALHRWCAAAADRVGTMLLEEGCASFVERFYASYLACREHPGTKQPDVAIRHLSVLQEVP
jgi:uncharacterized protein